MKPDKTQKPMPRKPTQQRSLYKVELILEAAMRLLDGDGFAGLTTNAVATTAGVSIGTLYQYFPNKEAILDALAEREVAGISERVMKVMADRMITAPEDRIAGIVQAVAEGYGRRMRVHRLVMAHSLGRGSQRLTPMIDRLISRMTSNERPGSNGPVKEMSRANAFVATHAFVGVMRAMISAEDEEAIPQNEIEAAMARMLTRFLIEPD